MHPGLRAVAALVVVAFSSAVVHAQPAPQPPSQEKAPVGVLWMGEDDGDVASHLVDEVNAAIGRKQSVRLIDSATDRRVLAEGGPSAKVQMQLRSAESMLARGKLADAATALEGAEQHLFTDVPFDSLRARLGEVERGLLLVYDQLGRNDDAARAATRLRMAPGSTDDVKVLLDRHYPGARAGAALPPVEIVSTPAGAQVYRDLSPIGVTPITVDGGDRSIDFVDIEAKGFRRAHLALGMGGHVEVALAPEERLGVLVDHIRDQSPDAPAVEVAALGKRVGADRILVILPDGPRKVLARWLEVKSQKWSDPTLRVDNAGTPAMERLASYVAPGDASNGDGAQLGPAPAVTAPPATAPAKKSKYGMWGKWYTWVAAVAVVGLVVGLLVAQNVGDDKLTFKSSK
ncbi:MAG: hypothetical protein ABI321_11945 [Polyangia bacterium]